MKKTTLPSIRAKNSVVERIVGLLESRRRFLMVGHRNPDEDCLASMVSFALLAAKFERETSICVGEPIHEHFSFLINICRHNAITIVPHRDGDPGPIDVVVACDTPKPSMVDAPPAVVALMDAKDVIVVEIDHHLEADSAYIGDEDYRLVTEASSTCELIGLIALKVQARPELLARHGITDIFTRNFVLAVLTGIIGDSKMGKFLKSRREQRFYRIFSSMFNDLLLRKTTKLSNFSTKEEVFHEIERLSDREEVCFLEYLSRRVRSGHVVHSMLGENESAAMHGQHDLETVVSVSRSVADVLAEESGVVGLVAYYDDPGNSDFVQFRLRRSHAFRKYDLRRLLDILGIENGGGHEGAIGFRVRREAVGDFAVFTEGLLDGINRALKPHIGPN